MYLFFVLNSFDFSSPQLDFTNLKVLAELSNRFFGCCIFLFLLIFNQVCLSGIFYLCTIDFFIIYVIFISVNVLFVFVGFYVKFFLLKGEICYEERCFNFTFLSLYMELAYNTVQILTPHLNLTIKRISSLSLDDKNNIHIF